MNKVVHLRVFLSSPSDVAAERKAALDLLVTIPRRPIFRGQLTIDPVAWDDPLARTPLEAGETPQDSVVKYRARPSDCDLTIVILWSRFGTRLPPDACRPDGTRYRSGTEWEYEDALGARRTVWIYHRTEKPRLEIDDPQWQEKKDQYELVKEFLGRLRNRDGSLKGGWNDYLDTREFRGLFEQHLEAYVRNRLEEEQSAPQESPPSALNTAPLLPPSFVNRPSELEALVRQLVETRQESQGPPLAAVTTSFQGSGGSGKTTLAQAVCRDSRVRTAYPDAVLWVDVGETPDIPRLLARQVEHLTGKAPIAITDERTGSEELRRALEGRAALLVLDDVWEEAHARPFLQASRGGAHLVTTRNQAVAARLNARAVEVNEMKPDEATELLARWLNDAPDARGMLGELARALGEWPLLLELAGAHLRELVSDEHLSPARATARLQELLDEHGFEALDATGSADEKRRNRAIAVSLEVSLKRLGDLRERFLELGIFPEDTDIPFSVIERLWGATAGLGARVTEEARRAMRRLSLFARYEGEPGRLRLHDVIRAYLRRQIAGHLATTNKALLDAFGAWHEVPAAESYFWRHVGYHLVDGGRKQDLQALLLDHRWLAAKLAATSTNAVLADFERFDLEADKSLRLLRDALRLSAHVLDGQPGELASQLVGRLLAIDAPEVRRFVDDARSSAPRPFLEPLWSGLTPPGSPLVRTLEGHQDGVAAVALSADGQIAVTGSNDHTLKVWELASGQTLASLSGHKAEVLAVALSRDGRTAVSGSNDRTLKVWDLATGQLVRSLAGHEDRVWTVALSPDGTTVVSGSEDCTIKIWDLASGQLIRSLEGHQRGVGGLTVSADGRTVVSGSDDGTIGVWDLASGQLLRRIRAHERAVGAVALSADGRTAISASRDRTLKVWNLASGQLLHSLKGHEDAVWAVAVDTDGRIAVSGSYDGTLKIWDLTSGRLLRSLEGHQGGVRAVALSTDGRTVVSGSYDRTIKIWDLAPGCLPHSSEGPQRWVLAVALSADGTTVISGSNDGTLKIWDLPSGQLLRSLESGQSWILSVALSADGTRIISGSNDRSIRVWDFGSGQLLCSLDGHHGGVGAVALAADGRTAISGSDDRTLKVWDTATSRLRRSLHGHQAGIGAVALTADGRTAISGSNDRTLKVWDLATGRLQRSLEGHEGEVVAVALSANGKTAVSGSKDRTLKVWDPSSGKLLRTLVGHKGGVRAIALGANDEIVVSGSYDRTLKAWSLDRGLLASFTTEAALLSVATDGHRIVAGDALGRIHALALRLAES